MGARYSQTFTLADIFDNKKLKDKIPQLKSYRTISFNITQQIMQIVSTASRPYYQPQEITDESDKIIISGNLVGNHDGAVNAVYMALMANKDLLSYSSNNFNIIKSALIESKNYRKSSGFMPKLYLRTQSMQEIQGMSNRQIQGLLGDIMDNIVFGDNFPETQKKFKVNNFVFKNQLNYSQNVLRWKYKVGDV